MPFVSVVIPVYNRQWCVKRAVDTVLAQDFRDFELIAVDDGSTDATPDILASYKDRLKVIRQDNRGVSAARNRGIAEASGSLVAFLDSDDSWYPQKLSVQADFFSRNPEALACQTQEVWIRNGRRVNPGVRHEKPSGNIFIPSLSLCLVSPSAVMLRKSLLDKVGGFDESLPACEDYDLWLRVGCRHPVYLVDRPLVIKYGGYSDQLSRQPGLDRYRIASIEKLLSGGMLSGGNYSAAVSVLKRKCGIYAKGCIRRGRLNEAEQYLRLAERY